jgi:hypothetical protein
MALIRCPGCAFDTSDSLAACPHCGAALGRASHEEPTASLPRDAPPARRGNQVPFSEKGPGLSSFGRAFVPILVLLALFVAPKLLPLLAVLGIVWLVRRSRRSNQRSLETEALQVLLRQAGGGPRGPAGRPLERLRRIEREISPRREA